jgi:hypothetical protein
MYNVCHLLNFFQGNCSIKKLWLIADIVLSIVISAFALFCTIPSNFYITVGVKLMALSGKFKNKRINLLSTIVYFLH